MKIIFYNIAYGTGMDGHWKNYLRKTWRFFWLPFGTFRDMVKLLQKENADVICLAEVDSGSFRNRFRSQAKALAEKIPLPFFHSETKYHPRSIWRWMHLIRKQHDAVLSRHEGEMKKHYLKSGMKRLVQEYVVNGYSIFTVHLAVLSRSVRQRQLRELAHIIKECPRPHIVCGDFNINTGLEEIKEFIQSTRLISLIKSPSFPSIKPVWYLDLFLASPGVKIHRAGVINTLHSDHLPVFVEVASL